MVIVGFVALMGIGAFAKFGTTIHRAYVLDGEHFEGRGFPGAHELSDVIERDIRNAVEDALNGTGICDISDSACRPGSCFCFAAGTLVATETGDRPIEGIVPGDRVWARDPDSGAVALREVQRTWINRRAPVVDVELSTGLSTPEHIRATADHPFWVEGRGWVPAGELAGDALFSTSSAVTAHADHSNPEFTTTYNLDVEGYHTYFVGRSHALVHNQTQGNGSCTCPGDSAGLVPGGTNGPLACGQNGSYGDLPKRPDDSDLEKDHVPSKAALQRRAEQLVFGEKLTQQQSTAMRKQSAAYRKLERLVGDGGQAVAIPSSVHSTGRTYKRRNTRAQQEQDAADLAAAARRDIQAIQAELDRQAQADPNNAEKAACANAYRQNTQSIQAMTQAQYDAQITSAYNSLTDEEKKELADVWKAVKKGTP